MATTAEGRRSSFLSLIASKTLSGVTNHEKTEEELQAEEEQKTHSMLYVARMKYLDDSDQIKPNTLFMTRRQAQKAAQTQDTAAQMQQLKKLEVAKKPVAPASTSLNGALAWKKNKASISMDERNQTWIQKFQAGCHFWQNEETGECRLQAPVLAHLVYATGPSRDHHEDHGEDDDSDEEVPFPDAFAFLNTRTSPNKPL